MNFSVYSADRATHLRIMVVALIASTAIVGFSISARFNSIESMQASTIVRYQQVKVPGKEALWVRAQDGTGATLSANQTDRSGS
jgi:hypothetical protein